MAGRISLLPGRSPQSMRVWGTKKARSSGSKRLLTMANMVPSGLGLSPLMTHFARIAAFRTYFAASGSPDRQISRHGLVEYLGAGVVDSQDSDVGRGHDRHRLGLLNEPPLRSGAPTFFAGRTFRATNWS